MGGLHNALRISALTFAAACDVATPAQAADPLPANAPVEISVISQDDGKSFLLQNDYGRPFYISDKDQPNKSTCGEPCQDTWIPVYVRKDSKDLGGVWSHATRPDGSKQWAYKGKPLYTFGYNDHEPPTAEELMGPWGKWSVFKP
jgi:predicted lipoprotein with Yx(FWY)xxD motif